jgi:hypothetical protein
VQEVCEGRARSDEVDRSRDMRVTATEANKLPPVTEKVWQSQIVGLAKTLGYRVYHPFLSKWSEKGYPDLTLVSERQQRVVWIECKTEKGKMTEDQMEWIELLHRAGQEAYVFRPSDWDEAANILQRPPIPGEKGRRK